MSREIRPIHSTTTGFTNAKNAWSLNVRAADSEHAGKNYDSLFFCYDRENTRVYEIVYDDDSKTASYLERSGTEFEHDGETLTVSTLANQSRVVQCRRSEIRTYDATDLSLSQIIPMIDDETDAELKIVHTSFCDPYLLVIRDDSTVQVLRVDETGDAEPLENEPALKERKWLSGCLSSGMTFSDEPVLFLLGDDGGLHLFSLPDFEPFYSASMVSYLPTVLSSDLPPRRAGAKEILTELLVADIGTEDVKQSYLILRSALDDLTLYEPYITNAEDWKASLRFRKVPFSYLPKFDEATMDVDGDRTSALLSMRIGRFSTVLVPGATPTLVLKEESSLPKALSLHARNAKALTPLNHQGCENGFGIVDDNGLKEYRVPENVETGSGWCVQRVAIGDLAEEVRHVAFHDGKQMYVVATCKNVDFYFPEEDGRHQEQDGKFHPHPSVKVNTLLLPECASRAYTSTSLSLRGATSIVDAISMTPSFLFSQPLTFPFEAMLYSKGHIPKYSRTLRLTINNQTSRSARKYLNTSSISSQLPPAASYIPSKCLTSIPSPRSRSCLWKSPNIPTSRKKW
jgi:cleavage and polyadenylation specificity factor subunit 1